MSRMFGLAMPSVSNWKKVGIPKVRMMFLQVAHKDALMDIDVEAATTPLHAELGRTTKSKPNPPQTLTSQAQAATETVAQGVGHA